MVWCCFGRPGRKWSQRVWSPDGAAHITELSPTFSTTSLIPLAHPHNGQQSSIAQAGSGQSAEDGRRNTNNIQPVTVGRAATYPSLPSHVQSDNSSHWVHSTNFTPSLTMPVPTAHSHPRRRSSDLPLPSGPPLLNSALRPPRPRPQSVPGRQEMADSNSLNAHVYPAGAAASPSRFRSSMNLPQVTATRLRSATRSANNLQEAAAHNSSFYDRMSSRLNEVIDQIDHEVFSGVENAHDPIQDEHFVEAQRTTGAVTATRNLIKAGSGSAAVGTASFSKVWLYTNSRLPPYLSPLKVYMPTYPLLCLAAQYSLRVYDKPTGREREDHIKASLLNRRKAMTLKSLPVDDMNTIVFAIRGSSGFLDWAVNFRPAPSSPEGFLDDPGNLCHAGFLDVAKGMIKPVATRLRTLLAENPGRSACSLLITGHSAGGAVAQLLYAHMLSKTVESELSYLTGFFKRVHCITFGTPPVSLLPLTTPRSIQNRKSLFFSFVNEGDPVSRADPAIVKSLLKLYASPSPSMQALQTEQRPTFRWHKPSTWAAESYAQGPLWSIPNATLSMGGRIIILRPKYDGTGPNDIEAVTSNDEALRDIVFGDPACHMMTMYSKRIEILATRAVTVGGFPS